MVLYFEGLAPLLLDHGTAFLWLFSQTRVQEPAGAIPFDAFFLSILSLKIGPSSAHLSVSSLAVFPIEVLSFYFWVQADIAIQILVSVSLPFL